MTVVAIARSPASQNLTELAHEINVRLQKADDHRLSASLKLAEAKTACKTAGISFKTWVGREINQISYPEAARLAKIGGSPDPAKALEDMRQKKATGAKILRVEKSAPRSALSIDPPRPTRGKAAIILRVREAIAALSGLPPPEEVIGYLSGTDDAVIVGERLQAAAQWLAEFTELWPGEEA